MKYKGFWTRQEIERLVDDVRRSMENDKHEEPRWFGKLRVNPNCETIAYSYEGQGMYKMWEHRERTIHGKKVWCTDEIGTFDSRAYPTTEKAAEALVYEFGIC